MAHWQTLHSDADAVFDTVVSLKAEDIEPQVTWGTSPEQVLAVGGKVPNPADESDPIKRASVERALQYMGLTAGTPLTEIAIDKVFIGSCTNSRIEDLRAAAAVAKGKKIAANVKLALVVPGSGMVKRQAEAEGLDKIFTAARIRVARAGLFDVSGDERRPPERRRALRVDVQPQLRRPPGSRRPHPSGQPRNGRGCRRRRPLRRYPPRLIEEMNQ